MTEETEEDEDLPNNSAVILGSSLFEYEEKKEKEYE